MDQTNHLQARYKGGIVSWDVLHHLVQDSPRLILQQQGRTWPAMDGLFRPTWTIHDDSCVVAACNTTAKNDMSDDRAVICALSERLVVSVVS